MTVATPADCVYFKPKLIYDNDVSFEISPTELSQDIFNVSTEQIISPNEMYVTLIVKEPTLVPIDTVISVRLRISSDIKQTDVYPITEWNTQVKFIMKCAPPTSYTPVLQGSATITKSNTDSAVTEHAGLLTVDFDPIDFTTSCFKEEWSIEETTSGTTTLTSQLEAGAEDPEEEGVFVEI